MVKTDFGLEYSPQGLSLVRHRGRQLCSFVDPVKEAEEWVIHYDEMLFKRKALIVLGLGAGYHVDAVARRFSGKILVVENSSFLIFHFAQAFPHLKNDISFLGMDESVREENLKKIPRPFSVLTFAPAVYDQKERYRNIYECLNGRSPKQLERQYHLRAAENFFLPHNLSEMKPAEIYRKLAMDQAVSVRWRNLFRMMGELIR